MSTPARLSDLEIAELICKGHQGLGVLPLDAVQTGRLAAWPPGRLADPEAPTWLDARIDGCLPPGD